MFFSPLQHASACAIGCRADFRKRHAALQASGQPPFVSEKFSLRVFVNRMVANVAACATHQFQVLKSIVGPIAVLVMNNLRRFKAAAEMPTHHQSMLWNKTLFVCIRMLRRIREDVAAKALAAPLPCVRFATLRLILGETANISAVARLAAFCGSTRKRVAAVDAPLIVLALYAAG